MKIGFQGDIGSNAEEATGKFVDILKNNKLEQVALITSKNVVSALLDKKIKYGVMAIRNSIIGEVIETKNAINEKIEMIDSIEIDIHHCLFAKNENSLLQYVASHIQALQQTEKTRAKILKDVQEVECIDTALAAKMLYDGEYSENYAVICRKNAGNIYGLKLIAENIEDDKSNKTTFGLFRLKD